MLYVDLSIDDQYWRAINASIMSNCITFDVCYLEDSIVSDYNINALSDIMVKNYMVSKIDGGCVSCSKRYLYEYLNNDFML